MWKRVDLRPQQLGEKCLDWRWTYKSPRCFSPSEDRWCLAAPFAKFCRKNIIQGLSCFHHKKFLSNLSGVSLCRRALFVRQSRISLSRQRRSLRCQRSRSGRSCPWSGRRPGLKMIGLEKQQVRGNVRLWGWGCLKAWVRNNIPGIVRRKVTEIGGALTWSHWLKCIKISWHHSVTPRGEFRNNKSFSTDLVVWGGLGEGWCHPHGRGAEPREANGIIWPLTSCQTDRDHDDEKVLSNRNHHSWSRLGARMRTRCCPIYVGPLMLLRLWCWTSLFSVFRFQAAAPLLLVLKTPPASKNWVPKQ